MGVQVNSLSRYKNRQLKRASGEKMLGAVSSPPPTPRQYQIRSAGRLFQGSDLRGLIKLAVAARRK